MAEIAPTDPRYAEVLQFLYREAELLDTERQVEWLDLLAEDITYRMPVSLNIRRNGSSPYTEETDIFSGERQDVLRKVDGDWRLAKRLIVLDQAVVGTRHLAILL